MNTEQMQAAAKSMIEWLEHPSELGAKPAAIKCAGEFDRQGMHYYIFKYKKTMLGKWLAGVCGGYEGDDLDHCGHVFSEMKEFVPNAAEDQANVLVEKVSDYWKAKAVQYQKMGEREKDGPPILEEYIDKIESYLFNNDGGEYDAEFQCIMEEARGAMEAAQIGIEAVPAILKLMERHPLTEFGAPGALVHFSEAFFGQGYEELLVKSVTEAPAVHTIWMLNRIANGSDEGKRAEYTEILKSIRDNGDLHKGIRESAAGFLE